MKILGADNCAPMKDVRVNIWHCDKDGNYSGYGDQAELTYLRGFQITDTNGEVNFTTIFPGWYPGRVCHIHFQVYVSANYAAISQFTFDHDTVNSIYNEFSTIYTNGKDPQTPETDGTFSDGYDLQLASLTPSGSNSYDAYLEVTVEGSGMVGVSNLERETAKNIILKQNYPNPFINEAIIPFTLKFSSKVKFEMWSVNGKKMTEINNGVMPAGNHEIMINLKSLKLPPANYIYQIEVENHNGIYKTYKMMTLH